MVPPIYGERKTTIDRVFEALIWYLWGFAPVLIIKEARQKERKIMDTKQTNTLTKKETQPSIIHKKHEKNKKKQRGYSEHLG